MRAAVIGQALRRLIVVSLVWAAAGVRAASPGLSAESVETWLAAFAADYGRLGAEALWSRLDQTRLAERAAALDGLAGAEGRRHGELIGQRLARDRASYASFNQLTIGRRTDAGDHWTVLTHYNSDEGLFFYRRLRLEPGEAGTVRLADWADMPCDVDMAEELATLALLQIRSGGEGAAMPAARRAELAFYRDNPQKLIQLYLAMRATTQPALLQAVFTELSPAAKYGVVAREARTQCFVSIPKETVADQVETLVGSADEDSLRGLLMFRAGLRGGRPALALAGMDLLSAGIGEDAMWRVERIALLDQAGRLDEAEGFATETAELYPTNYAVHLYHLAALRRAGRGAEAERREAALGEMLGADMAAAVARRATSYAAEQAAHASQVIAGPSR